MNELQETLEAAVRAAVPSLGTVGLDANQLDSPDKHEALVCPAVLIRIGDIDWQTGGLGQEVGLALLTAKVVLRLPASHYQHDPMRPENRPVLAIADAIHNALRLAPGVVSRSTTRNYPDGEYYVVEHQYRCRLRHDPSRLRYVPVSVAITTTVNQPKP